LQHSEKPIETAFDGVIARFCTLASTTIAFYLSEHWPCREVVGACANKPSPNSGGTVRCGPMALSGLARLRRFLDLDGLALAGFGAVAGLMLTGLPAATTMASARV
jgi:hypothetical protein